MTVLIGGLRVLNANFGQSQHRDFTKRSETLTNDFFVNLLDMGTEWKAVWRTRTCLKAAIVRRVSSSGPARVWTLSLVQIPNSGPWRKYMECRDSQEKFVHDFIAVWNKVMNLDRFESP